MPIIFYLKSLNWEMNSFFYRFYPSTINHKHGLVSYRNDAELIELLRHFVAVCASPQTF